MERSIFCDRAEMPTDDMVRAALGPAYRHWTTLRAALALEYVPLAETWSHAGMSHGWALRLARRDRAIVYLTPLADRFRASLALPERAMPAALEADLTETIRAVVAEAPRYPEGRGVRIEVTSAAAVACVVELARIRMAS